MKSLILMLALSIGASAAVAGENPATYNTITGELDIPTVIVDDGVEEIDNVTLQNIERLSGGYLFEYIPPTDCLSIAAPPSTCEGGHYLISTPKEYECAVENFQVYPKNCISPDLYVTAFAFQDPKNKKLYANGFAYAWANSSTNAARYLQMNQKWGQGSDFSITKMLTGIKSYIGFPITVPDKAKYPARLRPLPVGVYLLPDGAKAQVPSFETWFKILETDFGVFVPLELQQLMIEPYTTMPEGQDVVGLFCEMTGCKASAGVSCQSLDDGYPEANWPSTGNQVDGAPDKSCHPEVQTALNLTGGAACKVGFQNFTLGSEFSCKLTTKECFTNFNKNYLVPMLAGGMDYSVLVGPLRAALAFCQDANPFNTGFGLGYNTAANPFSSKPWDKQTVSDRYTGREFIVENYTQGKLKSAVSFVLPFGADTKAGCEKYKGTFDENGCHLEATDRRDYDFLTEGYGFYDD